jgi:hypothetical protein
MKVKDIFDVVYGVNLELINCNETSSFSDCVNFVSRTSENNGVVARVSLMHGIKPHAAGTISCAASGSVLSTFVQHEPYYSGRDLYVLTPKLELKLVEKLFYCYVINANKYRYSYGRAANKTLKDIELPEQIPEWVYQVALERYYHSIKTNITYTKLDLDIYSWQSFKLCDLFDYKRGQRLKSEDRELGDIPLVTAGEYNNGVNDFIENSSLELYSNAITIDMFCNSFVHIHDFFCDDNILVLLPKFKLNKNILIFISTVINQDRFRYKYGRQYRQKDFLSHQIKLPAIDGIPNWQYMEEYIKRLPYSDKI